MKSRVIFNHSPERKSLSVHDTVNSQLQTWLEVGVSQHKSATPVVR